MRINRLVSYHIKLILKILCYLVVENDSQFLELYAIYMYYGVGYQPNARIEVAFVDFRCTKLL